MSNYSSQFKFTTSINDISYRIHSFSAVPTFEQNKLIDIPHKHYFFEIHYLYSGSETVNFNQLNKEVCLHEDEFLIIPPNTYHTVITDVKPERFCFDFSYEHFNNTIHTETQDYLKLDNLCQNITEPILAKSEYFTSVMKHFRSISKQPDINLNSTYKGLLILNSTLHLLTLFPVSKVPTPPKLKSSNLDYTAIERKRIIETYISDHISGDEGLNGLAKQLFLSERQTHALIKQYFGESYKNIIISQQMELADILLRDTELSLTEIAHRLGYNSYSGFYNAFKKYFSVSPEIARNNKRLSHNKTIITD